MSLIRIICLAMLAALAVSAEETPVMKSKSVLYPAALVERARANADKEPWAAAMQKEIVDGAAPWMKLSDDELWELMFGATIKRSWMVWSDGFCPACKQDVKMYTWEMDPWQFPWKTRCPHCKELFPKNDFFAFYKSGLDEHRVFQPDKADRSLLFNAEHPDPADPLHTFGVDDGDGYVDDEGHRWRFIGCYLIYGQWKRAIVDGVVHLGNAYMATGDARYAVKAAILLDRVADLFPSFDFGSQGFVYEGRTGGPLRGQVSTWHDACEEVRMLTQGYDQIFEAAKAHEQELTAFLSKKAQDFALPNPKGSWSDIQRNIEDNILRDTLAHRERIESNYPTTDRTMLTIKTVLGWPKNRDEVMALLDGILEKATAVDGLSGEKGLAGYSSIAPRAVSEILGQFGRLEPDFLRAVYERRPALHAMYLFHVDTWCMEQFYPEVGDSGRFGAKCPVYEGVSFSKNPGTGPSMFAFLWDLYTLTQDTAFVQVLYRANDHAVTDLPHSLFADDPHAFQTQVQAVIDKAGTAIEPPSVNKEQWHLALLRSGQGAHQRVLWIDYDSHERHSHADGMNIGLFAKGMDLIPELGYPPVGYGGWESQKSRWYSKTASHVTVTVDGKNQERVGDGATKLWADGKRFHAIQVSDPAMIEGTRYERTVALVDLDDEDSYVIDHFVVHGGKDHAKFFHSFFGSVETHGLTLTDTDDYGFGTEMRGFKRDEKPAEGWSVDWTIDDHYKFFDTPRNIHLRYTDLTEDAAAYVAEMWVDEALYGSSGGTYVPCIMTRRASKDDAPLLSSFAAVIEPYENAPKLVSIRRVPLVSATGAPLPDTAVGIEISLKDGHRDLCIMTDPESGSEAIDPANSFSVSGALGYVTLGANGPERIVLCNGTKLKIGSVSLECDAVPLLELTVDASRAKVVAGSRDSIRSLNIPLSAEQS